MSYLERFKSEQNVVLGLFGNKLLDVHVEDVPYCIVLDAVTDDTIRESFREEIKGKTLEKFFPLMFLKQSDQSRYGNLLKEFR